MGALGCLHSCGAYSKSICLGLMIRRRYVVRLFALNEDAREDLGCKEGVAVGSILACALRQDLWS